MRKSINSQRLSRKESLTPVAHQLHSDRRRDERRNPQDRSKAQVKPETQVLNRSSVELSVGRAPIKVLDKKLQASVKHLRAGKLHSGAERNVGAP